MLVGTSSVDITPDTGTELCGFASRIQPADHVVDPLFTRVLCLDENGVQIILINLDLIGVEDSFVQRIRSELKNRFGIPGNHIHIFTTHTHSGPGTIHLNYCGEYDSGYVDTLRIKIIKACSEALKKMDHCVPEYHETEFQIGVNRRNGDKSALPLKSLAWKKEDGNCKAVLLNYPMHPVCLNGSGISADYPGIVCKKMGKDLPGNPLVFFGLGPAGDIDPPKVGVSDAQMWEWGWAIARTAVYSIMGRLGPTCPNKIRTETISIPLNTMSPEEIDNYADEYLASKKWNKVFGPVFQKAVEKWRRDMKGRVEEEETGELEIGILEIGVLKLVFINAELFSEFEKILKERVESPFIVVSCANGLEGYLPDRNEYEKGGYEVETAIFFYNSFLPGMGSLELLAEEVVKLSDSMTG